jgi:hypothetical protein
MPKPKAPIPPKASSESLGQVESSQAEVSDAETNSAHPEPQKLDEPLSTMQQIEEDKPHMPEHSSHFPGTLHCL